MSERDDAIEECAQKAEALAAGLFDHAKGPYLRCAAAIRSLKGPSPSPEESAPPIEAWAVFFKGEPHSFHAYEKLAANLVETLNHDGEKRAEVVHLVASPSPVSGLTPEFTEAEVREAMAMVRNHSQATTFETILVRIRDGRKAGK